MSKKSLIASITIGSSLLLSSFVGQADQASAMANSGQKVNQSYQQEQQQKALQYNSTKTTTTPVSAPVQKQASISKGTYKVVSGDTLSSIASKHGVSYKSIMDKNDLNSTMIYPGQTLTISGAAAPKKEVSNESAQPAATVSNGNYTVAQGDTLGKIATANSTSVSNLMAVNNLNSTMIYVGQSLKVTGTAAATQEAPTSNVIQASNPVQQPQQQQAAQTTVQGSGGLVAATKAALGQIGVPYVFGGSSTSGFDCSGLIDYALKQGGYNYGRMSAAGYYSLGTSVSTPQYGDLVFFKDTYKAGISHVGFYIGGGQMISASGDQVQIDNIGNSYWKAHFAGYKRF